MTRVGEILQRFRALPLVDLDAVASGNLLVVAPHPDDESLGCGGLLAEACRRGRPPVVVIVSDGSGSHPGSQSFPPERLARLRAAEVHAATRLLGVPRENLTLLGIEDGKVPTEGPLFERAVAVIAALAERHRCGTIFTTWEHDPHPDHQATYAIARMSARRSGGQLRCYPIWGWCLDESADLPRQIPSGWRLDVSRHLASKRRAIAAHCSQSGNLIHDDPDGFRLPPALLEIFDRPFEVFLAP